MAGEWTPWGRNAGEHWNRHSNCTHEAPFLPPPPRPSGPTAPPNPINKQVPQKGMTVDTGCTTRTFCLHGPLPPSNKLLGSGLPTGYDVVARVQVYLTDVCTPATLAVYMARLSAVPSAAMIFGPGLGGGLSKFGLNVPILTDGCICLAAAVLVYVYLPESPAWKAGAKNGKGSTGAPARPVAYQTYILGLSQMLNGIMFSTQVSMLAIALDAKYGFTSLQVALSGPVPLQKSLESRMTAPHRTEALSAHFLGKRCKRRLARGISLGQCSSARHAQASWLRRPM